MSKQQVVKVNGGTGVLLEIEDALKKIRDRAYSLFEARGCEPGCSLTDWFQAERDLFDVTTGELAETETSFELKLPVPGFAADQLSVGVDQNWFAVRGKAEQRRKKPGEYSEFERKDLFHRFELASPIDTCRVKADLEDGILRVRMPKVAAKAVASEQVHAKASAHAA